MSWLSLPPLSSSPFKSALACDSKKVWHLILWKINIFHLLYHPCWVDSEAKIARNHSIFLYSLSNAFFHQKLWYWGPFCHLSPFLVTPPKLLLKRALCYKVFFQVSWTFLNHLELVTHYTQRPYTSFPQDKTSRKVAPI